LKWELETRDVKIKRIMEKSNITPASRTLLSREKQYLYKAERGTGDNCVPMLTFFVTYLHEPFFTFTYWFTSSSKDMELYMKTG
jgi:hypothetical protein